MDYLRNFARNAGRGVKTEKMTVRLTEEKYDKFKTHCDSYGLSMSEAINILIRKETQK